MMVIPTASHDVLIMEPKVFGQESGFFETIDIFL